MRKFISLFFVAFMLFAANYCLAQENTAKPAKLDGAGVMISGVKGGGEITVIALTENEISVDKDGFSVSSFVFTVSIGDDLVSLTNSGNKLSERQKALALKKNPGEKVYIEDIICKDNEGNAYSLSPVFFKIK
jgi:hypothetical protein